MPAIVRSILAVLAGLVIGMVVNTAIGFLNALLFFPGLNLSDHAAIDAAMAEAAPVKLFGVVLAHSGGAFVGAWLAARLAGRAPVAHGLVIGAFFLLAGIVNLMQLHHPLWMRIIDPVLYLPAGWLGGWLVSARQAQVR